MTLALRPRSDARTQARLVTAVDGKPIGRRLNNEQCVEYVQDLRPAGKYNQ